MKPITMRQRHITTAHPFNTCSSSKCSEEKCPSNTLVVYQITKRKKKKRGKELAKRRDAEKKKKLPSLASRSEIIREIKPQRTSSDASPPTLKPKTRPGSGPERPESPLLHRALSLQTLRTLSTLSSNLPYTLARDKTVYEHKPAPTIMIHESDEVKWKK